MNDDYDNVHRDKCILYDKSQYKTDNKYKVLLSSKQTEPVKGP